MLVLIDGEQNLTAVELSEGINMWLWICMRPYLLSGGCVIHAVCGGGINDHALLGKSKIHIDMTNAATTEEHYTIRIAGILPCKSGQFFVPPPKESARFVPEEHKEEPQQERGQAKAKKYWVQPESGFLLHMFLIIC